MAKLYSRTVGALVCLLSTPIFGRVTSESKPSFYPVGLALGSQPSVCGEAFKDFRLNHSFPLATLDYGHEVAGYPFFEVESLTAPVQIEVKYSEEAVGLKHVWADGPLPFNIALANTYRVETFEISEPGRINAFLLQGGQRWQSIRLLTEGSVAFSAVGFEASIPVADIENLPGSFTCDDDALNEIWKLGARAAVASCLEAGTQRAMWEIDDVNGAYVRGMRAGTTYKGTFLKDYTLEFDTKIDKGGIGWTVAFPIASPAQGIQLNLVAEQQDFVNANTTIFRPNSIVFGYGYSFVNVTTLTSFHLDTFDTPFSVQLDEWYRIKTVLDGRHLAVSIDDISVFNVTLAKYWVGNIPGGSINSLGSWGFGGWQDQAGYFRNVVVYDTLNDTEFYRNPMTDASQDGVIREYGVQENSASLCLDGPKRDRLGWLGDFLHTARIIGTSTSRHDLTRETLQFYVDWQTPSGLMPYAPPMGYDPAMANRAFARGGGAHFAGNEIYGIILPDYQILGVLSFTEYVRRSNDLTFARDTWDSWKANLEFVTSNINSTTGLLSLISAFLGPSQGGSAINCALVEAFKTMADVAAALGEDGNVKLYESLADKLALAINENLWNEELGVFSIAPANPRDFSVPGMAFCITSGTATPERAARFLSALPQLALSPGFKDSSLISSSDPTAKLSPNTNGFLLSAILSQQTPSAASVALDLIKSLWTPMISDKKTGTGTSWEYVGKDGKPGLGLFTSLSHPWGGAPTYILTEWVAGIQAAPGPAGFGYRNWIVAPEMGVYMGLKEASGKVLTAFDGDLEVHWQVRGGVMDVTVRAPAKTSGVFRFGKTTKALSGQSKYYFRYSI